MLLICQISLILIFNGDLVHKNSVIGNLYLISSIDLANIAIAMVTASSADTDSSKKDENTLI